MFKQPLRKPQSVTQVAAVLDAKPLQGRQDFAVAALKPWVKRRAGFLRYGNIYEAPVDIDGGVPAAIRLIDADSNQQCLHHLSPGTSPHSRFAAEPSYRSGRTAKFLEFAGKNRQTLCFTHYLIGMARLSDGDRAAAREHFQKTLDTKFYAHNVYPYARAYLARMKRDETWPKWIEVKK